MPSGQDRQPAGLRLQDRHWRSFLVAIRGCHARQDEEVCLGQASPDLVPRPRAVQRDDAVEAELPDQGLQAWSERTFADNIVADLETALAHARCGADRILEALFLN